MSFVNAQTGTPGPRKSTTLLSKSTRVLFLSFSKNPHITPITLSDFSAIAA
ncbi:hypothetical protein SAMN00120144_4310 [Hymenobacter roseosalivarius DSM 11622]|uniref:Uncharacterized protein n=1 Tax=Hymenobacter roseosalivarius DSM 11622 TaxID=645990 RepID=A0A1W1W5B0_9BACT|nr:hypothetical protein SAMN00120144_4310 [Hymenobacter roseosalivarius DSM 11622]